MTVKNNKLSILQKSLIEELVTREITFKEGNPMPVSLSPRLISQERYLRLQVQCEHILEAIETLLRLYVDHEEVQNLFPELKKYRNLTLLLPPYRKWIHIARFDIAETQEGKFQIMETNSDCPGGILFTPFIHTLYKETSIYEDVIAPLGPLTQLIDSETIFIQSMVEIFNKLNPNAAKLPNIAFISSSFRPIVTEMDLFSKIAQSMGLNSKHIRVEDLNLYEDKVAWDANRIDIVHQKFDAFIDDNGDAIPCIYRSQPELENSLYYRGIQNNDFLYFNSFPSSFVAENKRILALLTDEKFQKYFTPNQQRSIKELCPLTLYLTDDNKKKDLVREVSLNKDKYVLKSVIDSRGRGVLIGKYLSKEDWNEAVLQAINKPYIVQEYIPQYTYKAYTADPNPIQTEVFGTLAMYMINGKAAGLCCRASEEPITNISKNGFAQPVYISTSTSSMAKLREIEEISF